MTAGAPVTLHRMRFTAPASARIVWPASFGRRFLVTVDVEEEFDWRQPFSRDARGVGAIAALPAMHARLAAAGVGPLYMIDHPVAADPWASAIVAGVLGGGTEIGAQLHPWVNPPHDEAPGRAASFAGNLPSRLEAAKLDALIAAIEAGTGRRPRAYRAGRYGLGPATFDLLAARGFRVDTSMRARYDYRRQGGADFGAIDGTPFHLPNGLIEMPLSTIDIGRWRGGGQTLHGLAGYVPRGRGLLARAGLLSRVPLTPEGVDAAEAVQAIQVADAQLLVLSFHSPSLVAGHTPYVRDASDLARFHRWWDDVFAALRSAGYAPASLADVIAAAG